MHEWAVHDSFVGREAKVNNTDASSAMNGGLLVLVVVLVVLAGRILWLIEQIHHEYRAVPGARFLLSPLKLFSVVIVVSRALRVSGQRSLVTAEQQPR